MIDSSKRPIEHLLGEPVLVEAYLENWQPDPEWNDVALLLTAVKLTDYETGKTALSQTLDHCWLWIPENLWKTRYKSAIATDAQMLLNDRVLLCCTVSRYMRSNGTVDYGLKPRNEFPVSVDQSHVLRKANQSLWRHAKKLRGKDLAVKFTSQCMLSTQLNMKAADWREIGYSWKDAKANVGRNISAFPPLENDSSITGELMERLYLQGSHVITETQNRIEASSE